jgi:hypothetical protein
VSLVGERYVRTGRQPGLVRWTPQAGSIYLADQKLPITVPRVRDRQQNREVPLTLIRRERPHVVRVRECEQGPQQTELVSGLDGYRNHVEYRREEREVPADRPEQYIQDQGDGHRAQQHRQFGRDAGPPQRWGGGDVSAVTIGFPETISPFLMSASLETPPTMMAR